MVWHVFMNSEYLSGAKYSSTLMNENFLYCFPNVVTRNFSMSRCESLLLDGNPKGYEVAEHIVTKVELNPPMLSTLKNSKSIWSMNPGANLETSMVVNLYISVGLVKRQIGQGSSKWGGGYGRPSMSPFIAIFIILIIYTWPNLWWIIWDRFCFYRSQTVETKIFLFLWEFIFTILHWR